MKMRKDTIDKYINAVRHAFYFKIEFRRLNNFAYDYKIGRPIVDVLLKIGVLKKDERRCIYYVDRVLTKKDIITMDKMLYESRIKYNKPQPKPKIVTQRDWNNERPTALLSVAPPPPQVKKFSLFWGLLEFEY